MTSEQFVKGFYLEKESLINAYFDNKSELQVSTAINSLRLNDEQLAILKFVLDSALTDMCYTILLGLDRAAQIGGSQEMYKLYDQRDNKLSGEIEGYAWEYFQNQ